MRPFLDRVNEEGEKGRARDGGRREGPGTGGEQGRRGKGRGEKDAMV